jgi:hypothetical protein
MPRTIVNSCLSSPATVIILIIRLSVLQQVQSLFQSKFSKVCDLMFHFSVFCIFSFHQGHPVAAYAFLVVFPSLLFFLLFPSVTSFRRQFYATCNQSSYSSFFIVCRIFLSSLTACNTSFFTRSVQIIFCILLQHHISKLPRYFRSTARSV